MKLTFGQRPEGIEEASHMDTWSKTRPVKGNSRCKDSQVGGKNLYQGVFKGQVWLAVMGAILGCEQKEKE